MVKEEEAEAIYNKLLTHITHKLLGNNTTFMGELNNIGNRLFKKKYIGTFASDRIPVLKNNEMVILNLDKTGQSGSHWIAVKKIGKNAYVYDSFGRKSYKIIPSIFNSGNGNIIDTDYDAEQNINENDCGARSMAFLILITYFGVDYAMLI